MSEDLVREMKDSPFPCACPAGAERIEALEAALREIDRQGSGVSAECEALADIARRALEGDREV